MKWFHGALMENSFLYARNANRLLLPTRFTQVVHIFYLDERTLVYELVIACAFGYFVVFYSLGFCPLWGWFAYDCCCFYIV